MRRPTQVTEVSTPSSVAGDTPFEPQPPRESSSIFRPGENCGRVVQADRVGLLVDGEEFFRAFAEAVEVAEESILIVAWDFDSRTRLRFGDEKDTATVGETLNRWVRSRPNRRVHLLIWDYPMLYGIEREFRPIYGLGWKPDRRVRIHYDNTIPVGGSQSPEDHRHR